MSLMNRRLGFISLLIVFIGISLKLILNQSSIDPSIWKSNSNSTSSNCKLLKYSTHSDHPSNLNQLKYCEDLIHWEIGNLLIVSCDAGRKDWNTVMGPLRNPNPRGQLYIYHLNRGLSSSTINESKDNLYSLELHGFPIESDFHPLGIELYPQDQFTARLFVVNHRRDRSVIEVFQIRIPQENQIQVQLKWFLTLTDPLLNTPNSIVALTLNSLLITNDHFINRRQFGLFGPILHTIETLFRLPGGNVISLEFEDYNGQESSKVVINQITFANGISINKDHSILIIASSTPMKLLFYQIQKSNSNSNQIELNYFNSIQLDFGPDNLSIDNEDNLIISGHPSGPKLFLWVFNSNLFSQPGSSISLLNLKNQLQIDSILNLFKDNGKFFMSSSTGLILKDENHQTKLIATGLYQIGLLECIDSNFE